MPDMTAFDYSSLPYPVREDLPEAYRSFWGKLAAPGSWWTGTERVAIANEVRNALNCSYCAARKAALSPYNFPGEHNSSGSALPPAAVDAVHRIITDQGRITQAWVDEIADQAVPAERYVELAAVAVTVFSIDEFNRALGLPLEPLPQALEGEPDHYRPAAIEEETGFVPMLKPNGTRNDRERGLWPPGRAANVLRALSLVPDAVRDWQAVAGAQYLPAAKLIKFLPETGRSINRMQMEIVAGRVSSYNECFY